MSTLSRFYSAFAERDHATMAACYADDAHFSDPVFPALNAQEVRAMWKMLLTSGAAMRVTFVVEEETATHGRCRWDAHYTFGRTGRAVHNVVRAEFELRDGRIVRHRDRFNFWRWSRQALGTSGLLLGWTPLVRNKVQASAAASLRKAMGR